jgi:hypothetical protein
VFSLHTYGGKLVELYVADKKYSVYDKSNGHSAPLAKKHFGDHAVEVNSAAKSEEMQKVPPECC